MIRQYSTGFTTNTLYEIDGEEVWHCKFESESHPVNIKWERASRFLDEGLEDAAN